MGLFSPQIALKKMVPLCRQLATSYNAGIPVIRSLQLVSQQQKDPTLKEVLTTISDDIQKGSSLGDATRNQSRYLPRFFVELVSTGEHGGKLDVMLKDLAQYFEDRLEMQRQFIRAMTYPLIQLTFAWFAGTFALRLVAKLPSILKGKGEPFDLMGYFREYAMFQGRVMLLAGTVFAVCVVLARMGLFKYIWGGFTTFIWPLSNVTKKFALSRFFRSMSLLIGSGLRIDHCVINSAGVTDNPYIEKELLKTVPLIRDGSTLVEAFGVVKYMTPTAHEMLNIGEVSGNLEGALRKVSEYHLDEATHAVAIATRVLSLLVFLGVAGIIGYVVISFWSQYFGGMMDAMGI